MELPSSREAITAQWLSEALQTPIREVRLLDGHDGTTGRGLIEIDHDSKDVPRRLFVKLPPTDPTQRAFVVTSRMGWREVQFYNTMSAELPLRVPRCYFAQSSEDGTQYIMLLENLPDSGCTFRNGSTRYGEHYLRQMVAAFARLHAFYWETPRFATDLSWQQPTMQHDIGAQLVQRALDDHADDMPPVFREMGELYVQHTDAVHALWLRGHETVVHGDVHDGNFFYDPTRDEPGFLDWAVTSRAPGARDIGYFLSGTLKAEHQAEWGPMLLAHYREQLIEHGVDAPPAEQIWEEYRWHAAYVWVSATTTLAMGDEWQAIDYTRASLTRIHANMELLGCVEAIRSAM